MATIPWGGRRQNCPPPPSSQSKALLEWAGKTPAERKQRIAAIMDEIDFNRLEGLHKGKFSGRAALSPPIVEQRKLYEKMRSAIESEEDKKKRNRLVERAKERCAKEVFNLDEKFYEFLQWLYSL